MSQQMTAQSQLRLGWVIILGPRQASLCGQSIQPSLLNTKPARHLSRTLNGKVLVQFFQRLISRQFSNTNTITLIQSGSEGFYVCPTSINPTVGSEP
jgi:hypothetical protein